VFEDDSQAAKASETTQDKGRSPDDANGNEWEPVIESKDPYLAQATVESLRPVPAETDGNTKRVSEPGSHSSKD
jgi:hypothetical protein